MPPISTALIIGAGGGLGTALCKQWQQNDDVDSVIAISSRAIEHEKKNESSIIEYIKCDYSETAITESCARIQTLTDSITRVCICNGVLHNENVWPEKRIEDVNLDALQEVFSINSFIPLLWLKALFPLIKGNADCIIAVLSARVGSIGDNRSGGWYSYRASKAALNMLLKTAAIEFARRASNVKLIAFQPGTTDTALSKPFQAAVKPENLFTPEFVAQRLVDIMNNQKLDGELSFIDWENKTIDW
jgi:NAD(P)-dependent dehydrogenase (short-subunit alcohol dehydrogenase family)